MSKERVAIIGSGNWGSTIAKIIATSVAHRGDRFDPEVRMWVFEEMINGESLTSIINTRHENVKYLPNVALPTNVVAVSDLLESAADATILVFVVPHQFLKKTLSTLKGHVRPDVKAVSLIKGINFQSMGTGVELLSEVISQELGGVDTSVLMGANIATDVAAEQFCESTLGYRVHEHAVLLQQIFQVPYFSVGLVNDVVGVEMCGALKNIVALAAGFSDGQGWGESSKAALLRIGFIEMQRFIELIFASSHPNLFMESCGFADVVATAMGGRNRKAAEAFIKGGRSWDEIERVVLGGQKIQGVSTAKGAYEVLRAKDKLQEFPLFVSVYEICFDGKPFSHMIQAIGPKS
eukprot:GILJ01004688.1.p1 GENE.GILJ01004688.1~~GILJ01004688.1.p1  ORF type:complete len:364 (-),score=59.45 GILJ01004688.1:305-1354(-)